MRVGCYTLDLHCDLGSFVMGAHDRQGTDAHPYGDPHSGGWENAQFSANTERECLQNARIAGWQLTTRGDFCPRCVRNKRVQKR